MFEALVDDLMRDAVPGIVDKIIDMLIPMRYLPFCI